MKSASRRQRDGDDEARRRDRPEAKRHVEFDGGSNTGTLARQCGVEVSQGHHRHVQNLVQTHGREQVRRWAAEGMSPETMGNPKKMAAFRKGHESAEQSDPTAGMCPRCTRRHEAGKPIDCPECQQELQRARETDDGTDESVLRSPQSAENGEVVHRAAGIRSAIDTALGFGPGVTNAAFRTSQKAQSLSKEITEGGAHKGPRDAARHCLWMCLLSKEVGRDKALKVGRIYEKNAGGSRMASKMDIHNNKIGADCMDSECKSCCNDKLDEELMILDHD